MNELKTLKDIPWEFGEFSEKEIDKLTTIKKPLAYTLKTISDYKNNLRQEAINWIKELQKRYDKDDWAGEEQDHTQGEIDWIKMFFNITKEDLK